MNRRLVLKGALSYSLAPNIGRTSPNVNLISACKVGNGYAIVALDKEADIVWMIPLPGRGHMAAYNPVAHEVAAFARRPERFLIIMELSTGTITHRIKANVNRHFYGHGTYSSDGRYLFTTQNNLETLEGLIGVYDATKGYSQVGELSSGGIGPHDIRRLNDEDIFVIANGGMQTHPDSGRSVLNYYSMTPNLSYIESSGNPVEQQTLSSELRLASIRHLSILTNNRVAFGMQWQGDRIVSPRLVGSHTLGEKSPTLYGNARQGVEMDGYIGSVATNIDDGVMAFSSPRAGRVELYSDRGKLIHHASQADVSGLAYTKQGWRGTTGEGIVFDLMDPSNRKKHTLSFDNHLLAI